MFINLYGSALMIRSEQMQSGKYLIF